MSCVLSFKQSILHASIHLRVLQDNHHDFHNESSQSMILSFLRRCCLSFISTGALRGVSVLSLLLLARFSVFGERHISCTLCMFGNAADFRRSSSFPGIYLALYPYPLKMQRETLLVSCRDALAEHSTPRCALGKTLSFPEFPDIIPRTFYVRPSLNVPY